MLFLMNELRDKADADLNVNVILPTYFTFKR